MEGHIFHPYVFINREQFVNHIAVGTTMWTQNADYSIQDNKHMNGPSRFALDDRLTHNQMITVVIRTRCWNKCQSMSHWHTIELLLEAQNWYMLLLQPADRCENEIHMESDTSMSIVGLRLAQRGQASRLPRDKDFDAYLHLELLQPTIGQKG